MKWAISEVISSRWSARELYYFLRVWSFDCELCSVPRCFNSFLWAKAVNEWVTIFEIILYATCLWEVCSNRSFFLVGPWFWFPPSKGNKKGQYTANSRKVVRKNAFDNPEKYCGWFWVHCSSKISNLKEFHERDLRSRLLKESNKSRSDSYSVSNGVLIISHITFRDCRMHIFPDLSQENCMMMNL